MTLTYEHCEFGLYIEFGPDVHRTYWSIFEYYDTIAVKMLHEARMEWSNREKINRQDKLLKKSTK